MSDWRSRAEKVQPGNWKSRAEPVEDNLGVPDSPLRKALAADAGDVVEVQTPTGPAKFDRQGRRVFSSAESQQVLDAGRGRFNEDALETGLSALHGAANSLTTKVAGLKGVQDYLGSKVGLGESKATGIVNAYDTAQEDAAATVDPAVRRHPYANLVGAVAVPVPGPGKAAAGASIASRALSVAKPAAVAGGLNAFGRTTASEGAGEALVDTTVGTGVGGAFGVGAGALAGWLGKNAGKASSAAEEQAVKALTKPAMIDRLNKVLGTRDPAAHRAFARRLLDSGAIRFGDSAEDIATRASEKLDELGEGIGAYIETGAEGFNKSAAAAAGRNSEKISAHLPKAAKHDEAVGSAMDTWRKKDATDLAESLDDSVRGFSEAPPVPLLPPKPVAPKLEHVPSMGEEWKQAAARMRGAYSSEPDAVAALGKPTVDRAADLIENESKPTMERLFRAKSKLQGGVNYDELAPEGKVLYRDAVRGLKEAAHDTIGKGLSGEDLSAFKGLNSKYADQASALELAADRASRESAKASGSLGGKLSQARIAGAVGGGLPGELAAEGVGAADKLWSRRGPSTLAATFNQAGKGLRSIEGSTNPQLAAAVTKVESWLDERGSPESKKRGWLAVQDSLAGDGAALGPYAKALAGQSEAGRLAMHEALLRKDPKYAALVEQLADR